MTQQVNISQCARMYGKDRRWVYNRIKQHGISTQQGGGNTGRRFQLKDFIAHEGEPLHNKSAHNDTQQHNQSAQDDTTSNTNEIAVLRQENQHLLRVIEELRGDRDLQRQRETWLQGIIDRQLPPLKTPNQRGIVQRVMGWWQGPANNLMD